MESQIAEKKVIAIRKIHSDFKEIVKHEKCRTCSCFHGDILYTVYDTIKRFNESQPEHLLNDIHADFEIWSKNVDQLKMHG
jgi:hypothetical protein